MGIFVKGQQNPSGCVYFGDSDMQLSVVVDVPNENQILHDKLSDHCYPSQSEALNVELKSDLNVDEENLNDDANNFDNGFEAFSKDPKKRIFTRKLMDTLLSNHCPNYIWI